MMPGRGIRKPVDLGAGGVKIARYSLGLFTIRMIDRSTQSPVRLDSLGDSGADMYDIMGNCMRQRMSISSNDEKKKRVMDVIRFENIQRMAAGILRTGDYGYESDINDVETHSIRHKKRKGEAEMLPFYFRVAIPRLRNEGVAVLQRFKNMGVKTVLEADMR